MVRCDDERWLEEAARAIRAHRAALPDTFPTPKERMVDILSLVSRSMRETGDLAAARSRDPSFLATGRLIAANLALPATINAFSGSEALLERQFFELFAAMCAELRALPAGNAAAA